MIFSSWRFLQKTNKRISKGLLVSSNSSKKRRTNSFLLLRQIRGHQKVLSSKLSGWYVLFVFWKKSKTPKSHFEINWPLILFLKKNTKFSKGGKKIYILEKETYINVRQFLMIFNPPFPPTVRFLPSDVYFFGHFWPSPLPLKIGRH